MAREIAAPPTQWTLADLPFGVVRRARPLLAVLQGDTPVVLTLVAVALISHGLNMFQFPSFTSIDDEGIYASQAWAILREGQLSPYTYVYDHVPGGWILVAAWMALTGGPHAFGGAIDSGRVLMLLVHVASVVLLYRVARKLGCGTPAAAIGALLFTISPLALEYQRRLLLDNLMLFWCLLSLDLLLDGWGRLSRVTLSGICFGIALLTKETAIFLLVPMVFIAWQQRWVHQARFAVFGWFVPMAVVVSWYPLFAALKGELLPTGGAAQFSTSGYGATGVSLFDSLFWQVGRDGGGLFNFDNQFWTLVKTNWLLKDPVLVVGGVVATLVNLVRGCRARSVGERRAVATALLGVLPLLYLARGGIVFDFYILAAIPFLCLNLVVLSAELIDRLPSVGKVAAVGVVAAGLVGWYVQAGVIQPLYNQAPGDAGREALTWIKTHVPADSYILVRDSLWTDLREPGLLPGDTDPGFPNVQSYTKVATDPAIREGIFHDDWQNVDYLVMSPDLQQQLDDSNNTIALSALQNAHLVNSWTTDGSSLELYKVDKPGPTEASLLSESDRYVSQHFEQAGAYAAADGSVTSEAQAYALLRDVWSGNHDDFTRTWNWSRTNLLNADGLLAWKWDNGVVDAHSAADADTDTALALLMASRRWSDSGLLTDGTNMVHAIWAHDMASAGNANYVVAGDWAAGPDQLEVNPSYFAPYAYHVFQEVDLDHDWLGLIDSGYQLLFDSSAAALDSSQSAGLPPDWVGLDRTTGQLSALSLGSTLTTDYGYDAPRTYWRVALDLRWDGDGRAAAYLAQAGFLRDEVNRSGLVQAVYAHDGSVGGTDTSVVSTAGALAALTSLDSNAANQLYARQLVGGAQYTDGQVHWGDPNDLYAQEWGWLATALYSDALTDIWHEGT
jgi:endo-1,4-beta-D-glucanase Y